MFLVRVIYPLLQFKREKKGQTVLGARHFAFIGGGDCSNYGYIKYNIQETIPVIGPVLGPIGKNLGLGLGTMDFHRKINACNLIMRHRNSVKLFRSRRPHYTAPNPPKNIFAL